MKRKKRGKKDRTSDIRPDILQLLSQAFPGDVIEWHFDEEDGCYLDDLLPKLTARFAKIRSAQLQYESPDPHTAPRWYDDDDEHEDPPLDDFTYSYRILFLGLKDERFRFQGETTTTEDADEQDEEEQLRTIETEGTLGCVVGLSEIAPVALVRFDSIEVDEEGGSTLPDIGDHIFTLDGKPANMESHFLECYGPDAVAALKDLREKLATILASAGVTVLTEDEACKPVPWLEAGEEVWVGDEFTGAPITLREAFFFRGP